MSASANVSPNWKWSPESVEWSSEELSLLPRETDQPQLDGISLATFLQKSDSFPRKFPIDSNRCKTLRTSVGEETLERNINSAYPVVHENILNFYAKFIIHKRRNGNPIEKAFYRDMDLLQFVERLLRKRAVTFMGKYDSYTLLDGKKGRQNWESVGTTSEKSPLILKDCLSYEEIKLGAFLSVSSYTYFMNVGDRKNFGVFQKERDAIQDEGIIVGVIRPRLVKEQVMEYEELVITESQNTKEKGYGNVNPPTIHHLFANLYNEECLEYEAVIANKNKTPERLIFSIDTLFLEANRRALTKNTTAYIHVVGLGLGVWKKSPCQNKLFMDFCGRRIQILGKYLHNVSDICFAYINHDSCLNFKNGDVIPIEGHPSRGIKIHMYKREPHSRLDEKEKLLVVSYAWDGNALPGNEYWNKNLGGSGDSAAASSTQITEIHNPFINTKVCANNLKVIVDGNVVDIREYLKMLKGGTKKKASD